MRVCVSSDGKTAAIHLLNGRTILVSDPSGNVLWLVDHLLGLNGDLYLWKMEKTQELKVS